MFSMKNAIETRLAELGITVPSAPPPVGAYAPAFGPGSFIAW